MLEKVREIMARVFEKEVGDIGEDASPTTIDTWDSLRHMQLVIALEEEFGISFEEEDFLEMLSIEAVLEKIQEKKGAS